MAKPNYAFEKRRRDLAKKQKKEEKRQRKAAAAQGQDQQPVELDSATQSVPPPVDQASANQA